MFQKKKQLYNDFDKKIMFFSFFLFIFIFNVYEFINFDHEIEFNLFEFTNTFEKIEISIDEFLERNINFIEFESKS